MKSPRAHKKPGEPSRRSSYFFAIVIISALFIINIILFQFNFGFNLHAYVYAAVFSFLFLLTHTLIWMKRSIPRGAKQILKLFSKTGKEFLYEKEIRSTLNLSIHKFNYFMDNLEGEWYLGTDSEYFDGKRKYWLLPDGRSYLAKRFSLK